jgi:hypothetical protein
MALDHFFGSNAGVALNIVDILRIVTQQLSPVLEEANELMRWCPFVWLW